MSVEGVVIPSISSTNTLTNTLLKTEALYGLSKLDGENQIDFFQKCILI